MNSGTPYTKRSPEETANPISRLFFWWSTDLFWKGAHKELQQSDLYHVLTSDESERLANRLERYWRLELERPQMMDYGVDQKGEKKPSKKKKTPRLHIAQARAFWMEYTYLGVVYAFQAVVLQVLQPLFQGMIISYFEVDSAEPNVSNAQALLYAGCLILCILGSTFILHHSSSYAQRIGMKLRVASSSLIYRKTLQLSRAALTQTTAGQVINLLSNDVNRFDQLPVYLHFIWIMPIQLTIITYIMWEKVGYSTFIGVGSLLFLIVPLNAIFTVISKRLREIIARLTDARIQFMDELVAGIQVIKMYAWEMPFGKIVSNTRKVEVKKIQLASYVRAMYIGIMMIAERATLYLTLVPYVLMGHTLTANVTYVLATYFNVLQLSAALFFPQALIIYGETMISIKRLEEFLLLEEIADQDNAVTSNGVQKINSDIELRKKEVLPKYEKFSLEDLHEVRCNTPASVTLDRVCANWTPNQLPPTLCNVSMNINSGALCALVGPVGAGKSSLLHLLLKEMPLGAGTVKLLQKSYEDARNDRRGYITDNPNLRISYASQESWLFGGTVRENILFGQPFERNRYVAVTKACALTKDFRQLPYGDMSVVGERGASLSGGQRARVNLARAVYRQADIYLLDDPLSAVDTHVAKHLFKKCIEEYLRGKTRILVTHQLQFLERVDHVVALDRGTVKMQGTYQELSRSNQEFLDMINRLKVTKEADETETSVVKRQSRKSIQRKRSSLSRASFRGSVKSANSSSVGSEDNDYNIMSGDDDEGMESGGLSHKIFTEYFHAGSSYFIIFLLILMFILAQVSSSGTDYWLSYWTNLEMVRATSNATPEIKEVYGYMFNNTFLSGIFTLDKDGLLTTISAIYMYTFCVVACTLIVMFRSFFFMKVCMNTSRNLHNTMFTNVLLASMSFFHHNSSGRILNRFSKDVGVMDEWLPKVFLEATQIGLVIVGILVMEVAINLWMLIPLVILSILLYIARNYYLKTAQNVKRIEGVTKSPVFSHINATLNGLPTIRSSGEEIKVLLKKQFDSLQDIHSGAWYLTFTTASAFGLVVDLIATCFVVCVCFSLILLHGENILGGNVGLAISQALVMVGSLQYGIKQSVLVISQMTAVERIIEYTKLPTEGSLTSDNPPPASWPPKGRLCFKSVNLRYERDEPPVLKDLNVTIEAGWKVGVVGRTGAGKSSLISAVFRLFAEGLDGEISIDGKDTATLGLQELRSRISIIPQEPVLFSRSLRYNLDPFEQYSDTMLWDVLREVELNDSILDQKVQQGGSNFSVGQRQLICLARAILRNNRILILDEATANVDSYTDSLIQQTIRDKFEECTVLTIAHRLHTIIDSDRIIVMEAGRIVEFGCPHELLHNKPKGYFSQMVDKTGREMSQILREQAQKFCERNTAQRSLDITRKNSTESDITFTASL